MKKNLNHIKFFIILGAIIICMITFSSCTGKRAAKEVAVKFLTHYYVDKDFTKARELSTDATKVTIDFKEMMLGYIPNSESASIKQFEYQDTEIEGSRATCKYMVTGEMRVLYLSKIDGKWMVDMPEQTVIEPSASLSLTTGQGGFASATSEPMKLSDIPAN